MTRILALAVLALSILASVQTSKVVKAQNAPTPYQSYNDCVERTYGVTAVKFAQVYGQVASNCK